MAILPTEPQPLSFLQRSPVPSTFRRASKIRTPTPLDYSGRLPAYIQGRVLLFENPPHSHTVYRSWLILSPRIAPGYMSGERENYVASYARGFNYEGRANGRTEARLFLDESRGGDLDSPDDHTSTQSRLWMIESGRPQASASSVMHRALNSSSAHTG